RWWVTGLSLHIHLHALAHVRGEAAERLGPRHGRERARERGDPPVAGHPENGAQREPEQPPDHDAAPSRWPFSVGRRQPGSGASGASRGSLGRGSILALAAGGRDPLPPPPRRPLPTALFTPQASGAALRSGGRGLRALRRPP